MRKSVYTLALLSSTLFTGCSSVLNNLPGVYSLDIQQGNIINQEMIDQLRPNMTKRQVLYIMGSSMLVDVFHQKRWDYLYSEQSGGEARKQKRLSLFFNGDKLIGVQGDFRPSILPVIRESNETTVDVPARNLDKTLWEKISGFFNDEAPIKVQEIQTEKTIDKKTEEETPSEEISTKPLEEAKPQVLEEIEN
ncbi:MAG: outer membrane protein assembly factor BamE [Methylococcales bacterium]|nr:outer membrane protein assembly factor BamE [Methylococcales bacterium]